MDVNKGTVEKPTTCRQLCNIDDFGPDGDWKESELFYHQWKVTALRENKLNDYGGGDAEAVKLEKLRKFEINDLTCLQNALKASSEGLYAVEKKRIYQEISHRLDTYKKLEESVKDMKTTVQELDRINASAAELVRIRKNLITHVDLLHRKCNLENMENLLETEFKSFNVEVVKLRNIRQEIDVKLKERECFNLKWKKIIGKLEKSKMYLKAIVQQAEHISFQREEIVGKIKELNLKGANDLLHDTVEMAEHNLNLGDLYKKADFIWIKGTIRKTDEEEKRLIKEQEEEKIIYNKIKSLSAVISDLPTFNNTDCTSDFLKRFNMDEESIISIFNRICSLESEMVFIRHIITKTKQELEQQRIENWQQKIRRYEEIEELRFQRAKAKKTKLYMRDRFNKVSSDLYYALVQIQEMVRMLSLDMNPLLNLLGEKYKVTKNNYHIFLKLIGESVMELFTLALHNKYKHKKGKKKSIKYISSPETDESLDRSSVESHKLVTNETKESPKAKSKKKEKKKLKCHIHTQLSLKIKTEYFVPEPTSVLYTPCAYCQEEHIFQRPPMELVKPLSEDEILVILTTGDINTPYNIRTCTVPRWPD